MNIVVITNTTEKFNEFEWLTRGITAQSPSLKPVYARCTGEQPLNYQDRLGVITSMETQLAKSVTALIVFDGKSESDYEYVRHHLAKIFIQNAIADKKREPENMSMPHLAYLIARMVIDFSLNPELEDNYTAKGRLYYAGIGSYIIKVDAYRMTWKP